MPRFPFDEWQVLHTRLTVFPMLDATSRSQEWWQEVTGAEPDETVTRKGSGTVKGAFGPDTLVLNMDPERIDWVLQPSEEAVRALAGVPDFVILGPASEIIERFSAIATKWLALPDVPLIARMAFGAVLIHPEADRQSAYRLLPEYLPVKVDPESSDFLFQINPPVVPSATGVDGLLINRLSKWGVARQTVSGFNVAGSKIPIPASEACALSVTLDINTSPAFSGPVPQDRLLAVYRELVSAGQHVAETGVTVQ
jgi:hypothetical protein